MLDHEPDHNATPELNETPPPPRRRRAASRPAGPPSSAPDAPPIAQTEAPAPTAVEAPAPAAEAPPAPVGAESSAPAAAEPPAKRTRRAPRKTAAAPEAATAAPASDDTPPAEAETPVAAEAANELAPEVETSEVPSRATRVRTPRKRAAKKAGPAAEESVDELVPVENVAEAAPLDGAETPPTDVAVADDQATVEPVEDDAESDPDAEGIESEQAEAEADAPEAAVDAPETENDSAEAEDAESDGDTESDETGSRRRRRRGGRRRRRGGSSTGQDDQAEDHQAEDHQVEGAGEETDGSPAPAPAEDSDSTTESGESGESESDGTRRRRRRRRRRGEETGSAEPTTRPRSWSGSASRAAATAKNEVTGIDGSTRMEAKRQRRREGREAGRRRAPILSEAEFLARRESVARKMIIRQREDLAQIAVLEDDILVEHYVDRDSATSLIGNVYLGRVQNVLPSMEAAFIDIGRGRNAVLYAGEVDWDSFGAEGQNRKVEKVLKSGQTILVQVTKDPVGAKGARLTNHVSIPGRYIVYAPGGHLSGISRKLPDNERERLKDILADLVGESASVIVRTAAEGASEEELVRDVNRLKAQWADIERKVAAGNAPQLLYGEPDLTVRIVRDLFTEDFSELIISGNGGMNDAYDAIEGYVDPRRAAPGGPAASLGLRRRRDLFAAYRLDEQIAKALERKVFLPSGGSLVIDRTEAMTVIDVNTGKFTGSGGNLEATVTSNNLEAAEEIVRQLRLRDIGGIIVIDFIDMVLPTNRELLLRRLVECLGRDRTRHQVAEVTSLGLVQMTRKKIGTGLLEAFSTECPHCHGRGYEMHDVPVDCQKQADGGAREQRGSRETAAADPAAAGHGSADQRRAVRAVRAARGGAGGSTGTGARAERPARNRRGGRVGGADDAPSESETPAAPATEGEPARDQPTGSGCGHLTR